MIKVERNNLIKKLYNEIIAEGNQTTIAAGNVKLKQKIAVEDEKGRETWTAIAYHDGGTVFLLDKEYEVNIIKFGDNNNYKESNTRDASRTCEPSVRILEKFGSNAFLPLKIDLFSHDGLRDYGVCKGDLTGIMPYDMYRNNRENIEPSNMWLSTPNSTPSGYSSDYVQYVFADGDVGYNWYGNSMAVRPFCILKSDMFVSCEERDV